VNAYSPLDQLDHKAINHYRTCKSRTGSYSSKLSLCGLFNIAHPVEIASAMQPIISVQPADRARYTVNGVARSNTLP